VPDRSIYNLDDAYTIATTSESEPRANVMTLVEQPPLAADVSSDVAVFEGGTAPDGSKTASALVVASYLILGAIAFWPLFPDLTHKLYGVEADYEQSVWFIAWIPHALAHGLNPFYTGSILVPTGANLAQNTASPLLGIFTVPLAPLLGAVARTNLLMVLAMPASATSAFVVLRKWEVWLPAAALGGLIYGFSPYMVGQALGHVELIFIPLLPFIALTLVSMVRGRGSPKRLGWQLGLLIVAQYLISPEVLTTTVVMAGAGLFGAAILRPTAIRDTLHRAILPALLGLAVVGVLLAYPIWLMVAGPQHFTGRTWPADNPFHNDLFNFLVPGPLQKTSLGLRSAGIRLAGGGDITEAGGYIGVPVLLVAGYLVWRSRRSARMQIAAALAGFAALLTLGSFLAVNGHTTRIPMPFWIFDHLPFLDDVLPARMNLEVAACLGAVMAFGLDDLHSTQVRRRWRHAVPSQRGTFVTAGLALAVVVATQMPSWPGSTPYLVAQHLVARPASVLPALIKSAIPSGDPVAITYPYATFPSIEPMIWQADAGFRFRLLGGYAYRPGVNNAPDAGPAAMTPPGLQQFLGGEERAAGYGKPNPVSRKLVGLTRRTIAKYDIRLVVVEASVPGGEAVKDLFEQTLGSPNVQASDFFMWTRA
jgi:hypothetical protein